MNSKQLAKSLGPKWKAYQDHAALGGVLVSERDYEDDFEARDITVSTSRGKEPRLAVLALAEKLEGLALELRDSVKPAAPQWVASGGAHWDFNGVAQIRRNSKTVYEWQCSHDAGYSRSLPAAKRAAEKALGVRQ